jgi:hypothetical protein
MQPYDSGILQRSRVVWIRAEIPSDLAVPYWATVPSLSNSNAFRKSFDVEWMREVVGIDERCIEGIVRSKLDGTT